MAARNNTDWDNVRRLQQGSAIEVLLNDGRYLRGNFEGASDARRRWRWPIATIRR